MSEFQGIPLSSPPLEISALEPMTSPKLILHSQEPLQQVPGSCDANHFFFPLYFIQMIYLYHISNISIREMETFSVW